MNEEAYQIYKTNRDIAFKEYKAAKEPLWQIYKNKARKEYEIYLSSKERK